MSHIGEQTIPVRVTPGEAVVLTIRVAENGQNANLIFGGQTVSAEILPRKRLNVSLSLNGFILKLHTTLNPCDGAIQTDGLEPPSDSLPRWVYANED